MADADDTGGSFWVNPKHRWKPFSGKKTSFVLNQPGRYVISYREGNRIVEKEFQWDGIQSTTNLNVKKLPFYVPNSEASDDEHGMTYHKSPRRITITNVPKNAQTAFISRIDR